MIDMRRIENTFVSIGVVGLLVVAGCDSGDDRQKTNVEESEETSEQSTEPDTGSEDRDEDWESRVDQAMETKSASGSDDESARDGCTLFPDSCGDGETCFVVGDGEHRCLEYDEEASPGDECRRPDDCNEGQQCVDGRPGRCLTTCKPGVDKWGCGPRRRCVSVNDGGGSQLPWGVCRVEGDSCDPWPDDSCGAGEACVKTRLGRRCRSVPFAARTGDRCSNGPVDCSVDQTCVRLESGRRECRMKCDDEHPCERGKCAELETQPWGFCARRRPPEE